ILNRQPLSAGLPRQFRDHTRSRRAEVDDRIAVGPVEPSAESTRPITASRIETAGLVAVPLHRRPTAGQCADLAQVEQGTSASDALCDCEQDVDHTLVLTLSDQIERLVVSEVRVRRAQPETRGAIAHHSPHKVDNSTKLEEPFLCLTAWGGLFCLPSGDAAGIRVTNPCNIGGVDDITFVEMIEQ
ncbi:MAG: hypothetical protein ABL886_08270, partial [Rhodoglobus sp.]